jgi:hypothetical protein
LTRDYFLGEFNRTLGRRLLLLLTTYVINTFVGWWIRLFL